MTRSIAVPATRTVQQYGPVVVSLAAAAGLSLLLRGYLYPRPLFLLALVLGTWGHGLGPSLVGAGLSTLAVRFLFPELLPAYGLVSDTILRVAAALRMAARLYEPLAEWQMQRLPQRQEGYTLDLDSTVLERYGQQEGLLKGHNQRKHGRPSHHPLLAVLNEAHFLLHGCHRKNLPSTS
jgi:hypothetical protein